MCEHKNKVCKKLRYGSEFFQITLEGKDLGNGGADIDLWHCQDCGKDLLHYWHRDWWEER